MHNLSRLQADFQSYLRDGNDAISREISGGDDSFRMTRLEIYRHAYHLRLIASLASDYAALKAFCGESDFEKIARDYIDARPSTFRNLRWFGHALSGFLREHPRYSNEAVLSELAEFEWAQGLAFDAADAPQLQLTSLAALPADAWADLRFIAHPSLNLVNPKTNVVAIWHAFKEQSAIPEADTSNTGSTIAVWRRDFQTWFRTLEPGEATLWSALAAGETFGSACTSFAQQMQEEDEDVAPRAARFLGTWLEEGWVQGFELFTH